MLRVAPFVRPALSTLTFRIVSADQPILFATCRYFELPPPCNISLSYVNYAGSLHGHWLPGDSDERRRIQTRRIQTPKEAPYPPRWNGTIFHDALRALVPALHPSHIVLNVGLHLKHPQILSPSYLAALQSTLAAASQQAGGGVLTVWKTLGHTDWSYRAFLAMRQVLRGLDADIAHSNRSEAKMAAPYFDRVLDAGKLLRQANVTNAEFWDSVHANCTAFCYGVHLMSRGNNLLNLALLELLWPAWQHVGKAAQGRAQAHQEPLDDGDAGMGSTDLRMDRRGQRSTLTPTGTNAGRADAGALHDRNVPCGVPTGLTGELEGEREGELGERVRCRWRALSEHDAARVVSTGVATVFPPHNGSWPPLLVCELCVGVNSS